MHGAARSSSRPSAAGRSYAQETRSGCVDACMHRTVLALLVSAAALLVAPSFAAAAGVAYPDADWSEAFIPSSGGVMLHADVLRPKGATDTDKTPVIVS